MEHITRKSGTQDSRKNIQAAIARQKLRNKVLCKIIFSTFYRKWLETTFRLNTPKKPGDEPPITPIIKQEDVFGKYEKALGDQVNKDAKEHIEVFKTVNKLTDEIITIIGEIAKKNESGIPVPDNYNKPASGK